MAPQTRVRKATPERRTPTLTATTVAPSAAPAETAPVDPFVELGLSGLKRYSGLIFEEFLRDLEGDKALRTYQEMAWNDPTCAALLFAIRMQMRQMRWRVDPADESAAAAEVAEFVDGAREDMSQSWADVIDETCSMFTYGWAYHELVYKRRAGLQLGPDGAILGTSSRYDDGRIGWRKIPLRAQDTRLRWAFDDTGGLQGCWQLAPPTWQPTFLPIAKCLLFRPTAHKNNPEGMSVLRTAYRPWYFAKRIQEIEAIGIERDLAGLPVFEVPAEITHSSRTSAQAAIYNACKDIVVNIRRDEQEGVVMPQAYDPVSGNPLYKLTLLTTGGQRQFDTNPILQRYEVQKLQSVLADFIALGHEKVGSFALSSDKTVQFALALGAWADTIAAVFTRHAIPRLLALNGMDPELSPMLVHEDIETRNLGELVTAVQGLTNAGMPLFPDQRAENWMRQQLGLPVLDDVDYAEREAVRAAEQERATAAALAAQGAAGAEEEDDEPEEEER